MKVNQLINSKSLVMTCGIIALTIVAQLVWIGSEKWRESTATEWKRNVRVDTRIRRRPSQIPEIEAEDYTFEALQKASNNFRQPVIVRHLFRSTPALKKWVKMDYLPSQLGKYKVPVVNSAKYGTLQNDRQVLPFTEPFQDILTNNQSETYLFFPVKSRMNFNGSAAGRQAQLQTDVNRLVHDDLEVESVLWRGFGTHAHSSYVGSQIIIGRGSSNDKNTTGTGWHCAGGNNWFVQVAGRKRWYFLEPKYSPYMYPLRGGLVNMMTGSRDMQRLQKYLPLQFTDVYAGDMLYNPDWHWHTIKNYEGLSIGVPIREANVSLLFQNNFHYSCIVLVNKFMDFFGVDIGGYPSSSK